MARFFFIGILLLLAGCGEAATTFNGRLLVNGNPFIPAEGQMVQIQLIPTKADASPVMLAVDKTGKVFPASAAGILPAGNYKVAVMSVDPAAMNKGKMTDQFKNAFSRDKTTIMLSIKPGTNNKDIELNVP